jgi:hypothetical protein
MPSKRRAHFADRLDAVAFAAQSEIGDNDRKAAPEIDQRFGRACGRDDPRRRIPDLM